MVMEPSVLENGVNRKDPRPKKIAIDPMLIWNIENKAQMVKLVKPGIPKTSSRSSLRTFVLPSLSKIGN